MSSSRGGTPSGTVTFSNNGKALATVALDASGQASLSTTFSSAGDQSLFASYSGSSVYASGISSTVSLVVSALPAPPQITCSALPVLVNPGTNVTISATATDAGGLPLNVKFSSSAGTLVASGGAKAMLQTSGLPAGRVTITCSATDSESQSASASTSILVNDSSGAQALTAFQFTDSVGVNIHLHYTDTPYVTAFPQIEQAFADAGIHHYRNGIDPAVYSFEYANAESLAKMGVTADWLLDPSLTPAEISAIAANAPDSIEAFEGPNEDDADAGPVLASFMARVQTTLRSNAATASVPLLAPSLTQESSFVLLGNLSSLVSNGNMHDYYNPRYPETPAYGGSFLSCGGYGSMSFDICLAQMVVPGRPVISTETGYPSGTVPDTIIGRYILRTLFDHLQQGIPRTYLYELIDEVSSPGYGLLESDFTPKPAYTALKNTMALFHDGDFSQPGRFNFTLSGQTNQVESLLFQKSDGTYLLALWLAVPGSSSSDPEVPLTIDPQTVTVNAKSPYSSSTVYTLDDEGNMATGTATDSGAPVSLEVTDRVTVIAFAPPSS